MAARLALDELGDDQFESHEPAESRHVFGGLLIAQALRAAQLTVTGRPAHSLHASFVLAGTGGERLRYTVERTRDGASFGTRRVVASQERGVVLVLTADFHRDEEGAEYATDPTPGVPGPDGLAAGRYDSPWFESRDVPVDPTLGGPAHARYAWFRPVAPVPEDPELHQQSLAYLTDHGNTRAAREPHAALAEEAARQSVSLDHAVWFHRPVDVNAWLLSEVHPVATGRGRGLTLGSVRTANGELVATTAQEVLLRTR
ncbi:MAG: acyl-CoA thioesterase [Ilumatobacteraceae bacterium]|nr:acyl-CoA thioesterase [Ilumatobacteraceae bacterium]